MAGVDSPVIDFTLRELFGLVDGVKDQFGFAAKAIQR